MKNKFLALIGILSLPILALADDKLSGGDTAWMIVVDDSSHCTCNAYDTSRFGTILWWYDTKQKCIEHYGYEFNRFCCGYTCMGCSRL